MLTAIAKGTQTSPSVMSMDEAHKLSPGDFPSLNVNKLEEAHEDFTMEASEAGSNHNQYQVLAEEEGEEEDDDLMAMDEAKDEAEDEVKDEAEDEVGDKEEDEDEDKEETEDIPTRILPMPVCNYCQHYKTELRITDL
jgi:hypothetical protein